ncbi:hypothetical protein Tco_0111223 [Tanacetum coccineum]
MTSISNFPPISIPPNNTSKKSNKTLTIRNIGLSQTQEFDYGAEKPVRIILGHAGIFQTTRLRKISDVSKAPTQEYIRKLIDDVSEDDDFKCGLWVTTIGFINDGGEIVGGCFSDIKNYLKNEKLKKVVAVITSCTPNMIEDMNVTLKDPSGTTLWYNSSQSSDI